MIKVRYFGITWYSLTVIKVDIHPYCPLLVFTYFCEKKWMRDMKKCVSVPKCGKSLLFIFLIDFVVIMNSCKCYNYYFIFLFREIAVFCAYMFPPFLWFLKASLTSFTILFMVFRICIIYILQMIYVE